MPDRDTPIPNELKPFIAYNTPVACKESADDAYFYAALGAIGTDKTTFFVHVWKEDAKGTLTVISVNEPPTNAPAFVVKDGALILIGARGSTIVERTIPGYIDPLQLTTNRATAALRFARGVQALPEV